jgi:hypothetical protein
MVLDNGGTRFLQNDMVSLLATERSDTPKNVTKSDKIKNISGHISFQNMQTTC